jgi:hypothetical protein
VGWRLTAPRNALDVCLSATLFTGCKNEDMCFKSSGGNVVGFPFLLGVLLVFFLLPVGDVARDGARGLELLSKYDKGVLESNDPFDSILYNQCIHFF